MVEIDAGNLGGSRAGNGRIRGVTSELQYQLAKARTRTEGTSVVCSGKDLCGEGIDPLRDPAIYFGAHSEGTHQDEKKEAGGVQQR